MSRYPNSYYAATSDGEFESDPFEAGVRFDVVIVGGGLTGLNAALDLAGRGYRVCVLERHAVGFGASGRSGGQVIAGLGCPITVIERVLGAGPARGLWDATVEGLEQVRQAISRYRIPCDFEPGHAIAAHNAREARALRTDAEHLAENYRYPVRYFDASDAGEIVDSPRYHGLLFDPGSGHLHPLNYTLGIARAARRAGAVVNCGVSVSRIAGDGPCTIETDRGAVSSEYVLLCTNAYLDTLSPPLARHFLAVGSHIVATRPLDAALARSLIPSRAAVADTRRILDYFRLSADNRLLFGGRVGLSDPPRETLARVMRTRMMRVFPGLGPVEIEYAWGGNVAVTRSHAPHLGRLRGNICFAQGYSGHGMVMSGVAGRALAAAVAGSAERLDLFASIPNPPIPLPRVLRRPALAVLLTWFRLLDRI